MSLSHRISAFILPLFITSFLSAQVSVSGVVTNDKGDALSGTNVYLAGTSLGAAAKSDGKYPIVYFNSVDPNNEEYWNTMSAQEWAPFSKGLRQIEKKHVTLNSTKYDGL